MFISFEGIDGAGKSTVFERLKEDLLASRFSNKVIFTREPGGTKISEAIRQILISDEYGNMDPYTEALLYAAARRQNVSEKIEPALKRGIVVLSDRYVDSSLAYQGAGRKLGIKAVETINQYATKNVIPDLVVYFKIDPIIGLQRTTKREQEADRFEKEECIFFKTIVNGYEDLIKKNPNHYLVVDANQKPDDVYNSVKEVVVPLIEEGVK